jgi:hypothetical protein
MPTGARAGWHRSGVLIRQPYLVAWLAGSEWRTPRFAVPLAPTEPAEGFSGRPISGTDKQRKTMKITRSFFALAATGGVAAALFGGAAVHTAFTSSATGTINASTASIGTQLTNGTVSLTNAIPGETGPVSQVTITNEGSTPVTVSITFGTGSNAALDSVVDIIWNNQDVGSIANLANESFPLTGNSSSNQAELAANGQPNDSITIPVALMLESSADDNVANGSSDTVSYTITGTATTDTSTIGTTTPFGWNISKNAEAA